MEIVKSKYELMVQMLETLSRAISAYDKREFFISPAGYEDDLIVGLRSAVIQSFEYCTDHLWKYMKVYLEQIKNVAMETTSPSDVVRHALRIKLLSEHEAEAIIEMIKIRNKTSHIYKEEFADFTADKAEEHYQLMFNILKKMRPSLVN